MTLTEFLLARIAEDEDVARRVYSEGRWEARYTYAAFPSVENLSWTIVTTLDFSDASHIARHDPSRVLAECEAKRLIMELHDRLPLVQMVQVIRFLALPYADHPDYRPEWKP